MLPYSAQARWRFCTKLKSVPVIGPTRDENPRAYSIIRHDMPHREDAPPDAQHSFTNSTTSWLSSHYISWLSKQCTTGSCLTLQGWQSWFCQHLSIAPLALAPYDAQLCSCQRQPLDVDHLHTCTRLANILAIGTPGTSISGRLLKQFNRFLAITLLVANMCLIIVA